MKGGGNEGRGRQVKKEDERTEAGVSRDLQRQMERCLCVLMGGGKEER